jgi:predicted nucleotidyltransferase
MDKKAVLEIVKSFHKEIVARGIKPDKIILFGSYAQATDNEDSDIDLVLISNDFTGKDYWERIDILSDAIYEIFAPIEVTAFTEDEWIQGNSFIADFAHDGEVIYGS